MKIRPKIHNTNSLSSSYAFVQSLQQAFTFSGKLMIIGMLLASGLLLQSCNKDDVIPDIDSQNCADPCARPDVCNCTIEGPSDGQGVSRDNVTGSGEVVETTDGFTVKGELEVGEGEQAINFSDADLNVTFKPDGSLDNISGTARIPSPDPCMEIKDPLQFNLGYYTGRYINEEFYLGFPLDASKSYFVFRIAANLEMNVCTNDDPNATKPFVIKAPVGGEIVHVADYSDPFFYFSAKHDALGGFGVGASAKGKIKYEALQPINGVISSFEGNTVRKGTFSLPIFKVLEAEDVVFIQNVGFNGELLSSDPLGSRLGAEYQAGLNGSLKLALSVASFVTFEIPMGEASAAFSVQADTHSGLQAQAFVNGLLAPDLSWWPKFLPLKPLGQLRTSGFVKESGDFDITMEGNIGIEVPNKIIQAAGKISARKDTFQMAGFVQQGSERWGAEALFLKDETHMTAIPPNDLLNGLDGFVSHKIDSGFQEILAARRRLDNALENLRVEVSLRGLRAKLPGIVNVAKSEINKGVQAGKDRAKQEIKSALGTKYKLCTTSIYSTIYNYIDSKAAPYIQVLDRLKAAVELQDDAQTRIQLEKALRDLAALDVLSVDKSFTVKATLKHLPCAVGSSRTQKVKFTRTVIDASQKALLLKAADNVKYIQPASDLVFEARQIKDHLPSEEELNQLKNDLLNGVKSIPSIGGAGYVKNHNSGKYRYFLIMDGNRKFIDKMNPFSFSDMGDGVLGDLLGN